MEFLLIFVAVVVWLIYSRIQKESGVSRSPSDNTSKEVEITEEEVIKAQIYFGKKLSEDFNLPDAVSGPTSYTYQHLVLPWFTELVAKHRYDDKLLQKYRRDFIDYINALEDWYTYGYLRMELPPEKQEGKDYRNRSRLAALKARSIEEAFAAAIGPKATKELNRIQELGFNKFSRQGELAPAGKHYVGGEGELVPDKK